MILRKPYAFFIKYFKLFHAIIALFIGFLLYKSFTVYNFFNVYIDDYSSALTSLSPRTIINMYTFLTILIVIILTIVLLSVMFYKKKPKSLYIYSFIAYIALLVLFGITYPILRDISGAILDVRVSKALRDFYMMSLVIQAISLVLFIVRATGFDIKRFDFGTDLQQLDINEKDSEEIEVALEFDKNKTQRKIRSIFRNFKYVYGENKFIINTVGLILIVILGFNIYVNITVYKAKYNQGTAFEASNITLNVRDSYLTKLNSSGEALTSDEILVLKLDIKSQIDNNTLNTGLATVLIEGKSYSQNNEYAKELTDLGEAYTNQTLDSEYHSYILAFNIPEKDIDKKMTFKFNDDVSYIKGEIGAKNIYVKLNPINLDKKIKTISNKMGEQQNYDDSILESADLKINSYEINNQFKSEYKYCYSINKCIDSYEYITPSATGNYFKTLIKINGEFNTDNTQINNVIIFMNTFGTINYKINDTWKSEKINSSSLKSNFDGFYLEVPYDIKDATEVNFVFNIRNLSYKYTLK